MKTLPTVTASPTRDLGIELVEFEGVDRIANRDAVGYYYTIQRMPDESKSRLAVLFSGTVFYINTDAFDLPRIEDKQERFRVFAEAAIGDYLDEVGLPNHTPGGESATKIECFSQHFETWEGRPRASDDEIDDYIKRHLLWSWRFGHAGWELELSDCLRLHRPLKFIQRLVDLGDGSDWTVKARSPHGFWLVPLQSFLRRSRNAARTVAKRPKRRIDHKVPNQLDTSQPGPDGYDVALSFAGEDRQYVERVASNLKERGINVFYDKFEEVEMWGKNLADHFSEVYASRSRFVVMFVSKHYAAKAWPNYERQQAQAKAIAQKNEFILPVRFDDTGIPGLPATVAYLDARSCTPDDIAKRILKKLGKPQ